MRNVLVLGGQGNFGARIVRALADDATVIAGSRKTGIDIFDPGFGAKLRELAPQLVVNCIGPYQAQDYAVAKAAVGAGAHYIDLADSRAFVVNFAGAVDAQARAADRLAVSGASTLPALSSAVIDAMSAKFTAMESVETFIAPAQKAPRGAGTLRSVFSYLGKPFRWLEGGQWRTVHGWQALKKVRIGGMRERWSAACDVPDLELLPARYPTLKTATFRAALELDAQHFALAAAAGLQRIGLPLPMDRWAPGLDRLATWLDQFGTQLGGMLVRIEGLDRDGARKRLEWHITADGNHGPEIPTMAAILLSRKLLRDEVAARGAMPCMGLVALDEFAPEFARWGMQTGVAETRP
jgi:NAD(P)-dependent dehydrogenase (short-subunit alcohol dehydrogenase family)